MAEVADWSPVDDDNNSAPPVGAPEGMMPSAVNNVMRAMQGALRRNHDTIVAGTLALPYLPLVGGAVSGNVAINGSGGVSLSGVQLRNISSGLEVTHAAGGGIATRGPGAGYTFGDRDQVTTGWLWYANGGLARLYNGADRVTVASNGNTQINGALGIAGNVSTSGTIGAGFLTSTGNVNAGLDMTCRDLVASRNIGASSGTVTALQLTSTANINASGNVSAAGNVNGNVITGNAYDCDGIRVLDTSGGAPLLHRQGGVWAIQLQSVNTYYENQGHIFRNQGSAVTFTVDASGNINATAQVQGASIYSRAAIAAVGAISTGGTVQGGYINSTGNVDASGTINATGNLYSASGLYVEGTASGAYIQSRGDASVAGRLTTNTISMNGELRTSSWIIPPADHGFNCGLPGLNADSMHAYAFVVPSDARLKSDIETPTGCLELLQAIPPRTYRLADAPDPDTVHWGLVAQEVAGALRGRDFGGYRKDAESGEEGLAVNELLALLWGATRELAAKVEAMEAAHAR